MKKDDETENISHIQKLEEVIRQKKTESDALKKLMNSLSEPIKKDIESNKTKNSES
jgi:hypothetical protein